MAQLVDRRVARQHGGGRIAAEPQRDEHEGDDAEGHEGGVQETAGDELEHRPTLAPERRGRVTTMARRAAVLMLLLAVAACDGPKPPKTRVAEAAERTVVSLGTATPGGGFPVYGDAVAATINALEPSLDVKPLHTKGSTENVPLLERGEL